MDDAFDLAVRAVASRPGLSVGERAVVLNLIVLRRNLMGGDDPPDHPPGPPVDRPRPPASYKEPCHV
jgi:hypothetical protein